MKKLIFMIMLVILSSVAVAIGPKTDQPTFSTLAIRDYYTGSGYTYLSDSMADVQITIENDAEIDFEDMIVRVVIYDLDYARTYRNINIDDNDRENFRIPIILPEGTQPGYYPVRISVFDTNGDVHRVKHRMLFVMNGHSFLG